MEWITNMPYGLSHILLAELGHWAFAFVLCVPLLAVALWILTTFCSIKESYQGEKSSTRTLFWLGFCLLFVGLSALSHHYIDFVGKWGI